MTQVRQGSMHSNRSPRARWLVAALAGLALVGLVFAGVQAQAKKASGSLTTLFDSNNGNDGVTFDLDVLARGGIEVKRFDINVEDGGDTAPIQVWTRPGTADGFEASESGWTSRGSVQVTSQDEDNRTPLPISFRLRQGSYGVAIGGPGASPDLGQEYTDDPGDRDTFENDVLRLSSGHGLGAPLLDGGGVTSGRRTWNGTIYYRVPCVSAKKKLKKAKKQVKQAKKNLEQAIDSGSVTSIEKAERKLEAKLEKKKQAKRKKKRACA